MPDDVDVIERLVRGELFDGDPDLPEAAHKQVLQAGVAANVMSSRWCSNSVKWWAWTEWYTEQYADPAVEIVDFPVGPGDTIFVVVCAPQPNSASISLLNISHNQGMSVGIDARPGITSMGLSSEWIVEVPDDSPHAPIFTPVTFSECTGGSYQHGIFHLSGGYVQSIKTPPTSGNPYGTQITQSSIASETEAVVKNWRSTGSDECREHQRVRMARNL